MLNKEDIGLSNFLKTLFILSATGLIATSAALPGHKAE